MSDKELVLDRVRQLPEDVPLQKIAEEIDLLAAIQRGKQAAAHGRTKSHRGGEAAPRRMDCKVIWTDPAIEDLGEIVRYIAADDPSSARRSPATISSGPSNSFSAFRCLVHHTRRSAMEAFARSSAGTTGYSTSLFLTKDCRDLDYLARRAKRTGTVKPNKAIELIDTRCHAGCSRTLAQNTFSMADSSAVWLVALFKELRSQMTNVEATDGHR